MAICHYEDRGWTVDPSVARNNCFDLLCQRGTDVVHIEVKGTTGEGTAVLLTPNEVEHAREQFPHVALIVVGNIAVADEGKPVVTGGDLVVFDPWRIEDGQLQPIGFAYTVPG
jgi:hypothetical protein